MTNGILNSNWKALLDTILGKLLIPYELAVSNDEIIIKASPENAQVIQTHLQSALQSSERFFQQLPYSIHIPAATRKTSELHDQYPATLPTPIDSVDSGIGVFKSFFGSGKFDEIALNIDALFSEKNGATSKDHVLYSKPAKGKHTAQIWHDFLNALLAEFNDIAVEQLRAIWLDPNQHLPAIEDELESAQLQYRGLIQQCFGIIEDKQKKQVQIYFNYGLLHRLIFSPQIALHTTENSAEIHVDKKHLLNYLQQLTQNGMLLRVYKNNEQDKNLIARPLFFGQEKLKIMPNHYTIIVDRSGSMSQHLDKLSEQVIEFIEKIAPYDPQAKVRIVFFNDKTGPVKEFSISEGWNIRAFIKDVKHGGETRLFGTIEEEINYLYQQNLPAQQNTAMVFFTDGQDTVAPSRQQAIQQIIALLNAQHQQGKSLPKIFTLGIGAYDHEALHLFSQKTNSPFIHLQSTADFNLIYQYLSTLHYQQEVLEFLVRTSHTQAFAVPITLDGNIQSPNLMIPFQEREQVSVKVRGQQLLVRVMDAEQVPLARSYDQLQEQYEMFYQIVADNASPNKKIQRLNKLTTELTIKDTIVFSEVINEINRYIGQLQAVVSQSNAALHQSLMSQAQLALGYESKVLAADVSNDLLVDWPEERTVTKQPEKPATIAPVKPGTPTNSLGITSPFVTLYQRISHWWEPQSNPQICNNALSTPQQSAPGMQNMINAICQLQPADADRNTMPSLHCVAPGVTAQVFLKQPEVSSASALSNKAIDGIPHLLTGDQYDLSSCQPVEYAGHPSVSCEGQRTTAIITPHLPARPFANLDGTLLLLQYGTYFLRKLFGSESTETSHEQSNLQEEMQGDPKETSQLLQSLHQMLEKTAIQMSQVKSLAKSFNRDIKDFQADLKEQECLLSRGALTKQAFDELQEEIQHFSENALPECTAELQKVSSSSQTPFAPLYSQQCSADSTSIAQLACVPGNAQHHQHPLPTVDRPANLLK